MLKPYASLALTIGLFATAPTFAQESFGGHPVGLRADLQVPAAPEVVMPLVDASALLAEDEARLANGIKGPYRFGFNHAVDLDLNNSGVWHEFPNGDRLWRLAIVCPEAYSINFEFHNYFIPSGAQVFVYSETEQIGAFTMASSGGQRSMGVTQLAGDRIIIEYNEPAAVRGQGRLKVGQVTHAYRDILSFAKGLGDSGSCNNNVICAVGDPWRSQIRSVAIITVGGSGLCTGQMINNCAQDGEPYFLTARHCLPGNQNVNNWVYRFNWNSPSCPQNQNGPTNQTVSGSQLLTQNAGSDVALIKFNNDVPTAYNVYFTGWDKSGDAPTSSVAIHHPSGDVKKISFDNQAAVNGTFSGAQCWRILNWEDGTTEGGSSGSGLWSQDGLLIGQLFGGQANCSNNINDYYGKFNVSYPFLEQWLGTCGDQLGGFPSTVGVDEVLRTNNGLTVAPNPTNGLLSITLAEGLRGAGRLVLYDALGQIVLERNTTQGTERFTLDLSDRTSGIYLLEILQDGRRVVERILLDR
ncbi:MAG: T9SS type A sorting domain-containing protein [Flavobacteriales bacterium]